MSASAGAAVSYYGPAPAPAEASRVRAPLLIHLAGLDNRVNATARPFAAAIQAAHGAATVIEHPNVDHAFNNDTSAARYNSEAATQAWRQTLDFFRRHAIARRHHDRIHIGIANDASLHGSQRQDDQVILILAKARLALRSERRDDLARELAQANVRT